MENVYNFNNDMNINKILNDCWFKCYNDIYEYNLRKIEGDMFPKDFLDLIEHTHKLERSMINNESSIYVKQIEWNYCNHALREIMNYLCNKYHYQIIHKNGTKVYLLKKNDSNRNNYVPKIGIIVLVSGGANYGR